MLWATFSNSSLISPISGYFWLFIGSEEAFATRNTHSISRSRCLWNWEFRIKNFRIERVSNRKNWKIQNQVQNEPTKANRKIQKRIGNFQGFGRFEGFKFKKAKRPIWWGFLSVGWTWTFEQQRPILNFFFVKQEKNFGTKRDLRRSASSTCRWLVAGEGQRPQATNRTQESHRNPQRCTDGWIGWRGLVVIFLISSLLLIVDFRSAFFGRFIRGCHHRITAKQLFNLLKQALHRTLHSRQRRPNRAMAKYQSRGPRGILWSGLLGRLVWSLLWLSTAFNWFPLLSTGFHWFACCSAGLGCAQRRVARITQALRD